MLDRQNANVPRKEFFTSSVAVSRMPKIKLLLKFDELQDISGSSINVFSKGQCWYWEDQAGATLTEKIIMFRSSHRRYSIKKVLLKSSQNSQENTFVGVPF